MTSVWSVVGSWEWIIDDNGVRVGVTTSRRERTTSTVVVTGSTALLVDPGWDPDELAWIARDLAGRKITVTAGFATHAHHDHVLWHPKLGTAARWASTSAARDAADNRAGLLAALGPDWPADLAELVARLTPHDGEQVPWAGARVDRITHDGHAKGHTALWIPAVRTLVAGDMLSDVELPLLEESSMAEYAAGLDMLRPFVDMAQLVIPGHGRPAIGAAAVSERWAADRHYLTVLGTDLEPQDARIGLPGMRQAHAHNRSRAAKGPTNG